MIRKNHSINDLKSNVPVLFFINQLDREEDKKSLAEEKKNILARNDLFEKKKQLLKNQSEIIHRQEHVSK